MLEFGMTATGIDGPGRGAPPVDPAASMTARQREVLRLRQTMQGKQIAEALGISKTIAFAELAALRALFGAQDDVQLVLAAKARGLI